MTDFNKNYLGHDFVLCRELGCYKCKICNCKLYCDSFTRYVYVMIDKEKYIELKINCNDYIIKNIIE